MKLLPLWSCADVTTNTSFFAYVISWKQRANQQKNTGWCFYIQLKTTYKIWGTFAKREKHLRLSFSIVLHSPLQLWYFNLNEYFSRFSFSSMLGQVVVAIRFLTRDLSLIWNTGITAMPLAHSHSLFLPILTVHANTHTTLCINCVWSSKILSLNFLQNEPSSSILFSPLFICVAV